MAEFATMIYSRLRLSRHTPVQWLTVDGRAQLVIEQLDEVNARRAAITVVAAVAAGVGRQ